MKQEKSFTLIEILVVIVVVGILSSIILVGITSITQKANIGKGQAFSSSLDNSLLLAKVSSWKLDESSGITAYDSWGENNGTRMDTTGACDATHCPQVQTAGCISNNCLSFDGVNDYVDCGNKSTLDVSGIGLTMSAWFYSIDENVGYILAKNETNYSDIQYGFYKESPSIDRIQVYINGTAVSYSPTGSVVNNKWYNTVIVYNGVTIAIYINGSLSRVPQAYSVPITSTNYNLSIGRRKPNDVYFKGLIDDVRLYNQALSSSQIEQDYYIGLYKLFFKKGISSLEYKNRLSELK